MKTDEELKQIALDLHHGRIFSDRHCSTLEDVKSSFMVLAFMEQEHLKKMEEDQVDFIYEYLSEAGPMSVNGRPCFFSMRLLTKPESQKMFDYYEKIKKAVESVV